MLGLIRILLGSKKGLSNFQTVIVTELCCRYILILIFFYTKVPLIPHPKVQPNIPSHSGEKVDFIRFAIFSISGHPGYSIRLNFTILKPCCLIMLHVKFEIH